MVARSRRAIPGKEDVPKCPTGYVVSFVLFHKQGLGSLASNFFHGLLHHYKIEL